MAILNNVSFPDSYPASVVLSPHVVIHISCCVSHPKNDVRMADKASVGLRAGVTQLRSAVVQTVNW